MKKQHIKFLPLALFYVALFFNVVAYSKENLIIKKIMPNGETNISENYGNIEVFVTVTTREKDIGKTLHTRSDKKLNSCTYSRAPCSLVDSIEISINNIPIFVARSVYSDLSDLNMVELSQIKKEEFILKLHGGDASESYRVDILFNLDGVKKRSFIDKTNNITLQETTYLLPLPSIE